MSSSTALPVLSPDGDPLYILDFDVASPTRISSRSPPSPAPIVRLRPRQIPREAERCTIAHPNASIASPPLLLMKMKPDVPPSAPMKRFRRNESAALFLRDPYQAAIDRERAASVAAALEHAFWVPKMPNAEGVELKIEDYLIAMTGDKLAKIPLCE